MAAAARPQKGSALKKPQDQISNSNSSAPPRYAILLILTAFLYIFFLHPPAATHGVLQIVHLYLRYRRTPPTRITRAIQMVSLPCMQTESQVQTKKGRSCWPTWQETSYVLFGLCLYFASLFVSPLNIGFDHHRYFTFERPVRRNSYFCYAFAC